MAPPRGPTDTRTALSWQRTALSLVTGSLVVSRLTYERIGPLAVAGALILVPLSALLLIALRGAGGRTGPRPGLAAALLTLGVALVALTQLVALAAGP